ncbi:unnamed protein product [Mesocestoides corti]|nr:unnamed protein product [Mesocestoides corti]
MLPGVIKDGPFADSLSRLQKSAVCSVATISGSSPAFRRSKPLAVGICNLDVAEATASFAKGKLVLILHTAGDKLFELCPPHILPSFKLGDAAELKFGDSQIPVELSTVISDDLSSDHLDIEQLSQACGDASVASAEPTSDELLMTCFVYALSLLKPTDLPLTVNVFYAKYMKTECPDGSKLDIKKTSYKKVGVFLEKMAEDGLIELERVGEGIVRLTAFHNDHPTFKELSQNMPQLAAKADEADVESTYSKSAVGNFYFGPPVLEEVRYITSKVAPFFAASGYSSGDVIAQAEICRLAGAYIDSKMLRSSEDRSLLNLDALLTRVCDPNLLREAPTSTLGNPCFQITFQDLITSLTKGLNVAFRLIYPPQSGLKPLTTQKPPKLKISEAKQNGKDVTRVGNLADFGINPKSFARYVQTKLACSASLIDDPTCRNAVVVQAQGSHRIALSKMLTETFGLSKNWIDGYVEPKKTKAKGGRKGC